MKKPFENFKDLKEKIGNISANASEGFLGKIGGYFNPEPQKERVLRHEDFNAAGDVYYADVSVAYKIAERVLWTILVIFVLFSVLFNYKDITYDNFYYLFKDFSSAVDSGSSDYEVLSYDSDSRQSFSLYRGGLATVSPSTISIYTATGRKTIRENINYSAPFAVCSDKYILVYDASGNSFSIYNSFARVFTDTTEYPITDACFAEDGRFAIVTRDYENKAVVYIYSKNFKKINKYSLDMYMFDVSIDSAKNEISMLCYDIGNGTGRTVLMTAELGNTNADSVINNYFDGEFPLGIAYLDGGRLALVTDCSVRIFSKNLKEINKIEYFDSKVTDVEFSDFGVAISTLKAAKNRVIVFDKSGELVYNNSIKYNVSEVGLSEDCIFVNTLSGVARISMKGKDESFLPSNNGRLLVYDSSTALICGDSKAEYLVFNK